MVTSIRHLPPSMSAQPLRSALKKPREANSHRIEHRRVTFQTNFALVEIRDSMKCGERQKVEAIYCSFNASQRENIDRALKAKILEFAVLSGSSELVEKFHAVFDLCQEQHLARIVFPACGRGNRDLLDRLLLAQESDCKCYIAWRSIEHRVFESEWEQLTADSHEYRTVSFLFEFTRYDNYIPSQEKLGTLAYRCIRYPYLSNLFSKFLEHVNYERTESFIDDALFYENGEAIKVILGRASASDVTKWVNNALNQAAKKDTCIILEALFSSRLIHDAKVIEQAALVAIEHRSPSALKYLLSWHQTICGKRPEILEEAILKAVKCRNSSTSTPRELIVIKQFCAENKYVVPMQTLKDALKMAEGYLESQSIIKDWINN